MTPIDPETMPMEELLALAQSGAEMPTEPVAEVVDAPAQPRNADGTFAPVVPPAADPVVPTTFTRTIDLGDGSGAQVFTADSLEGLVDKLTTAQTHATRKIRELTQVAKVVPKAPEKKQLTPDEEYLLGQRLISEPSKAVKELLEAEYGMPIEEIKAAAAAARQISQERVEAASGNAWIEKNPDFHNSDANGRRIRQYINRFCDGGLTVENMDTAYAALKADGLLQDKPAAEVVAPAVPVAAPKARASSLSSRISTVVATPTGPSLDELYKMPLHELEALANKPI
jgi:hypothetical protein